MCTVQLPPGVTQLQLTNVSYQRAPGIRRTGGWVIVIFGTVDLEKEVPCTLSGIEHSQRSNRLKISLFFRRKLRNKTERINNNTGRYKETNKRKSSD